jgi:RNA polymerase sigma factor (sigma-70 family)
MRKTPVITAVTTCEVGTHAESRPTTRSAGGESARHPDALTALASEFDHLYASVYRYLLHRFFDAELAEELTAQTFYQAATFVQRLDRDVRTLRVWLLRIATNVANTHYRRRRLRDVFLRRLSVHKPTATGSESPADSTNGRRLAGVRAVLLALRPKYQTVVVLRYYAQMSFADIAAVVGCREATVRARLSRAIREIRQRLDLESGTGSEGDD